MPELTKDDARSIVERARAGDQVAQALIIETRKSAEKGSKKAQHSRVMIEKYIAKNPPSTVAGDTRLSVNTNPKAQLALWNAQRGTEAEFAKTVVQAAPFVGPWALVCAILHGPRLKKGSPLLRIASAPKSKIAACVRRAFRLQRIGSDRRVPISSYCPLTACELGE